MSSISNTKLSRWKVGSCGFTLILGQPSLKMTNKMCFLMPCVGNRDPIAETVAVVMDEAVKKEQNKIFQVLINRLNECRKVRLTCD